MPRHRIRSLLAAAALSFSVAGCAAAGDTGGAGESPSAKKGARAAQALLGDLASAQERYRQRIGTFTRSFDDLAAVDPKLIATRDKVQLEDLAIILLARGEAFRIEADLDTRDRLELLRTIDGDLYTTCSSAEIPGCAKKDGVVSWRTSNASSRSESSAPARRSGARLETHGRTGGVKAP